MGHTRSVKRVVCTTLTSQVNGYVISTTRFRKRQMWQMQDLTLYVFYYLARWLSHWFGTKSGSNSLRWAVICVKNRRMVYIPIDRISYFIC